MRPDHRDHTVKGPRGTAALQELRSALQRVKAREEAAAEEHAAELRSQLALQRADHEGQVPGPPRAWTAHRAAGPPAWMGQRADHKGHGWPALVRRTA